MSHFESIAIIQPEGIEVGPMPCLNDDLKNADCPASKLSMATVWDSAYQVMVLIVSADPNFSFNKVSLANKARLFLRDLYEDHYDLFKCQQCGRLYYEGEIKVSVIKSFWSRKRIIFYRCIQVGCIGDCAPVKIGGQM
jgi:hypothetical protein